MPTLPFHTTPRLLFYIGAIALGGAVGGIDNGIVAITLAQPSFNTYMFPPGTPNASSLIDATVSSGSAGSVLGSLAAGFMLEKFGRRLSMGLATLFTIVGSVIQAAAPGIEVMIFGRTVAGLALGNLITTMPVYITELAHAEERARLVGVYGFMVAVGFCLANWIGYACSFAAGETSWRLALGMQIPLAVVLLGLVGWLPESPRWLAQQNHPTALEATLRRIHPHSTANEIHTLQTTIHAQIAHEARQRPSITLGHALLELFNSRNIKRTTIAIMVMQVGLLSGSLAIQKYQGILYASLGFDGRSFLLISGVYGVMGVIGQVINLVVVADRWERVKTMWIGCLTLASMLSILMALSRFYSDGHNTHGARAGIAFIFLFSILYAVFFNSTLATIAAEVFPLHLRGYGTATALFFQGVTAIWLGQVTPIAFEAMTWRYYAVFIGCLVALAGFYAVVLEETNRVGLEDVAGRFGDEIVAELERDGERRRKGAMAVHGEKQSV